MRCLLANLCNYLTKLLFLFPIEKKKSQTNLPFTKERNRENEKDPGKWTQNRIGKKSHAIPLDQISSKPNFEVHQDEGLVTPSKSNHHGNLFTF